jgi:hypothetical protein
MAGRNPIVYFAAIWVDFLVIRGGTSVITGGDR